MARKKRTELTSNERESEQKTVPDHIIIFFLSAIDVVKEGDSGAAFISNKFTFIKKKSSIRWRFKAVVLNVGGMAAHQN